MTDTFRDLEGVTRILKLFLVLGLVAAVVSLLSSFLQLQLIGQDTFTAAEAQANDARQGMIGLIQLALYLITIVAFAWWIVRANRNVRALGAAGLESTPGWAAGYFFVPILNLWKPYRAMHQLWRASKRPESWDSESVGAILPVWWTLWVTSNVLGQVGFRLSRAAEGLDDLRVATWVDIINGAVDVPLFLVAIALVAGIADAQQRHAATGV